MKLSLPFVSRMTGTALLPDQTEVVVSMTPVKRQFQRLKAQIVAGWNIEHKTDGSHKAVTADSVTIAGLLSVQGPFLTARLGQLTAATITANQNNYTPVDLNGKAVSISTLMVLRLDTDASRTLTGLTAPSPQRRQSILMLNVGANALVLAHASASSTATNRFTCPNSADLTIRSNGGVWVYYDIPADATSDTLTSGRWRVIGI